MAEQKMPEEVAREWIERSVPGGTSNPCAELLADLIRQERGRVFDAGVQAGADRERDMRWAAEGIGGTLDSLNARFAAARRLAVEGKEASDAD